MRRLIRSAIDLAGYQVTKKPGPGARVCWPTQRDYAQTFFEADTEFHQRYEHAQRATQMDSSDNPLRRQRHYTLNQLLHHTSLDGGAVVELGCWRGLSAYQIASQIREAGSAARFHLFDSFQGLSELSDHDVPPPEQVQLREQFAASLVDVQHNLREFDFIDYHQGWIPDRFSDVEGQTFSFVHVDVDLYQPTYDSCQFFYPRLAPYGIMVFDDYGSMQFPGAKEAVDQYLRQCDSPFLVTLPSGQAFLIKQQPHR